ncbi:hypothetical protein GCM10010435_41020 [Winogradskya consettensis]|uniref:Uncharacterized protein n=1 Tax=Winogradskya consettensis TaxID=113560 RepID=A0A919VN76_9ACTN|nr:hypothetical protein [Actinoplanes consettensis]GIM69807.1 hypothetical protein Aco04nite_17150 [Actinoplanes consettensis]
MAGIDGAANRQQAENDAEARGPKPDSDVGIPGAQDPGGPDKMTPVGTGGPYWASPTPWQHSRRPELSSAKEGDHVAVNIADLRAYATRMDEFRSYVAEVHKGFSAAGVIKPGTFYNGAVIYNAVEGDGGLTPSTLSFLKDVAESFTSVQTDMNAVILKYEATEDANKVTAEDISNEFAGSFGRIEGLSDDSPSAGK